MPKVSVIMSVFREPVEWIESSINSILTQTYGDLEFIIVNDNPDSDELRLYLQEKALSDKRIVLILNEHNIGLTKSLNVALGMAKGDYIARMDADDVAFPERFEKQVSMLNKNNQISVCHTNYCIVDEQDNVISHFFLNASKVSKEWLVWTNTVAHSTVMFRSSLLQLRKPLYNELRRSAQDYDLWTFLSLKGVDFGFINEELLRYRVSSKQVSKINKSEQSSNYYDIRRNYIESVLNEKGIIQNGVKLSPQEMIKHINTSCCAPTSDSEQIELKLILYRLYYTAAGRNISYVWKYFCDKRKLFFFFNFRMNIYMLFQLFLKNHWSAYLY